MRRLLCSVSSCIPNGAAAIPVSHFVPEAEWQALAAWVGQGERMTDYPALSTLMTSDLPLVVELDWLATLGEELGRIPPDSLRGDAGPVVGQIRDYLERASGYIDSWRASGQRTSLSPQRTTLRANFHWVGGVDPDRPPRPTSPSDLDWKSIRFENLMFVQEALKVWRSDTSTGAARDDPPKH